MGQGLLKMETRFAKHCVFALILPPLSKFAATDSTLPLNIVFCECRSMTKLGFSRLVAFAALSSDQRLRRK
jgi:hypothetical protein